MHEINFEKKNDVMISTTTFRNVFLRNKKVFQKKTFQDFETNFPETKKCFELFCFENACKCVFAEAVACLKCMGILI